MKKIHCHICNNQLKHIDIQGRVFPWKDFNQVLLLVSFKTLVCNKCGEILIHGKDTDELDQALEKSIRIQTAKFLSMIKIKSNLSQKSLSKKIGLSEVYLSEIGCMKKTVSSQIFNFLKILANHPNTFLDLESFSGESNKESLKSTAVDKDPECIKLHLKYKYIDKNEIQELRHKKHFENILGTPSRRAIH